jgi:hypothetical protein
MPALLAYITALCLLFGVGYGALNWLAQPEPVKMVSRARPKLHSSLQMGSQEVSEVNKPAIRTDGNSMAPNLVTPKPSYHDESSGGGRQDDLRAESNPATVSPDVQLKTATRGKEAQPADAEASSDEPQRRSEPKVRPSAPSDPSGNPQANAASSAPVATDRSLKRSRYRQAGNTFERRALAVMTLRTIEFPDGRRITQLIPYRGGDPSSPQ